MLDGVTFAAMESNYTGLTQISIPKLKISCVEPIRLER